MHLVTAIGQFMRHVPINTMTDCTSEVNRGHTVAFRSKVVTFRIKQASSL